MTKQSTLEYKGEVVFLTATSSGEYYAVAHKKGTTMVKRCSNHKTTVCLGCAKWEGVSDRGEVNDIGCAHTNLVEYAVANGVVLRSGLTHSLSLALQMIDRGYVEVEEHERGEVPE